VKGDDRPSGIVFEGDDEIRPVERGPVVESGAGWEDANEILGRAVETYEIRRLRHDLQLIRDGVTDDRVAIVTEAMRPNCWRPSTRSRRTAGSRPRWLSSGKPPARPSSAAEPTDH
jgi:hypothetical protein